MQEDTVAIFAPRQLSGNVHSQLRVAEHTGHHRQQHWRRGDRHRSRRQRSAAFTVCVTSGNYNAQAGQALLEQLIPNSKSPHQYIATFAS